MTDRRLALAVSCLALLAQACLGGAPLEEEPLGPTGRTRTAAEAEPSPSQAPTPDASPSDEPSAEPTTTDAASRFAVDPDMVRGLYTTAYSFWGERYEKLLGLVEDTEVNALVIDVKDESGVLLWDMDHPLAEAGGGGSWLPGSDPRERLQRLVDAGGYPIARVACFKDTAVAEARPDLAVQDATTGGRWVARKGFGWLNPYQEEVWEWCADVGVRAIEAGFAEVQFDYVRFPNGGDGDTTSIRFPGVPADRPEEHWRHPEQITGFIADAAARIHAAGGLVSADLFGLVTYDFSWNAQGTGQIIEEIAEHVDYISPMSYPSHYGPGNYGLDPHPVDYPYETMWNSMQEAQMRVQQLRAKIRPWLEDFSAPWMGMQHTPQRLLDQKRAVYENGIEGWMLWNAGNSFSESALEPGATTSHADPDFKAPYRTADPDGAPGEQERKWPGRPPCTPDREKLFIGKGNLAGSVPPTRAPGEGEPIDCVEDEPGAPPATSEPSDAASESSG